MESAPFLTFCAPLIHAMNSDLWGMGRDERFFFPPPTRPSPLFWTRSLVPSFSVPSVLLANGQGSAVTTDCAMPGLGHGDRWGMGTAGRGHQGQAPSHRSLEPHLPPPLLGLIFLRLCHSHHQSTHLRPRPQQWACLGASGDEWGLDSGRGRIWRPRLYWGEGVRRPPG